MVEEKICRITYPQLTPKLFERVSTCRVKPQGERAGGAGRHFIIKDKLKFGPHILRISLTYELYPLQKAQGQSYHELHISRSLGFLQLNLKSKRVYTLVK
jgi:hypothetical protein